MNSKTPVVSDFDGVWADSFWPLTELNIKAFAAIGRKITAEDYRGWYIHGIKRTKRELLTRDQEYQAMFSEFEKYNAEYYRRVKLFPWVKNFLPRLAKLASIVIVSSTKSYLIRGLLRNEGLRDYFVAILGVPEMSKKGMFSRALATLETESQETFFISDTLGDIREAKEFGFKTIAVTWGFHDRKLLESANPFLVVDSHHELLERLLL